MSWEPTKLERQRLDKLGKLRDAGIDPYPLRVERSHTIQEATKIFAVREELDEAEPVDATLCGRLVSLRDMGKTIFAHMEDGSGKIQLFLRRNEIGEESHRLFAKLLDLGDFVQAEGILFRTRMGEVSLRVSKWKLLSKALTPLPAGKEQEVDGELVRYSAFEDIEERYRQRYADLAVNPDVRGDFVIRSRMIAALRRFFDDNGFLEVETPILQPIYGGAAAKPFVTHHNQLKSDLYLRISFELYLKRLLVGGIERVYEIGRDFRNEGVDATHNPEFTQLEFYAAYWDYYDVMDFTERMVAYAAQEVLGTTKIEYAGNEIELGGKWHRMPLKDGILEFSGIDYTQYPNAASLSTIMKEKGATVPEDASWGKLVDTLLGDYVEPHLIQPTFVTQYPRDISPFAKRLPDDPMHVERFEFFIAGMEMGNAFTELNDPQDQYQRFLDMQRLYAADDDNAHPIDEDYVRAMRYGMPPNGGFGAGIDRLAMLFANKKSIRDVLLFPQLRRQSSE